MRNDASGAIIPATSPAPRELPASPRQSRNHRPFVDRLDRRPRAHDSAVTPHAPHSTYIRFDAARPLDGRGSPARCLFPGSGTAAPYTNARHARHRRERPERPVSRAPRPATGERPPGGPGRRPRHAPSVAPGRPAAPRHPAPPPAGRVHRERRAAPLRDHPPRPVPRPRARGAVRHLPLQHAGDRPVGRHPRCRTRARRRPPAAGPPRLQPTRTGRSRPPGPAGRPGATRPGAAGLAPTCPVTLAPAPGHGRRPPGGRPRPRHRRARRRLRPPGDPPRGDDRRGHPPDRLHRRLRPRAPVRHPSPPV